MVHDAYWTLLGYFNSLRLFCGTKLQIQKDVNDRLDLLNESIGHRRRDIELMSRGPLSAIPGHLQDMATPYPDVLGVILATYASLSVIKSPIRSRWADGFRPPAVLLSRRSDARRGLPGAAPRPQASHRFR